MAKERRTEDVRVKNLRDGLNSAIQHIKRHQAGQIIGFEGLLSDLEYILALKKERRSESRLHL